MQPAGVYFNHMRKAAGSTTGSTTIAWFQHIGQARNFYVTAMEFSFFASTAWLTCHPSSFVVVPLREPISRHVSEYHHAGPPYRCQTTPIRDTACFAEAYSDDMWMRWLDHTATDKPTRNVRNFSFPRGKYVANTYVKRLGGNCTLSSNFKALPLFQSKSLRQSVTLQMSPIYGVPRNVTQMKCPMRCPHEQKLEPRLALQALGAHDLVLISEWLNEPVYLAWLDWLLRLDGGASLPPLPHCLCDGTHACRERA